MKRVVKIYKKYFCLNLYGIINIFIIFAKPFGNVAKVVLQALKNREWTIFILF